MEKLLTELKPGEQGIVAALHGGRGLQARLRSLGVIEGQTVRKLSAMAWGGPVVVEVKRTQVAIGRGMASRILVRTN